MCKNGRNSPTTETPKFLFFTESHMDLSNAHACQCSHTAGHPWRTPCSWPTKGSVQIAGPRSRRRVFCFKSSNVMIIGLGFLPTSTSHPLFFKLCHAGMPSSVRASLDLQAWTSLMNEDVSLPVPTTIPEKGPVGRSKDHARSFTDAGHLSSDPSLKSP